MSSFATRSVVTRSIVGRCVVLGAAALLAAPLPGRAQQTEQELVQHLDTLVPRLRTAHERAAAARQAYLGAIQARTPTETVEIGPVRVLVVPGEGAAARDVVGRVWTTEYEPWVDASPALSASRIFFRWADGEVAYHSASFPVRSVQGSRWRSRAYMERGVRRSIGDFLKEDLLATRLGREWADPPVEAPADPTDIYRRVASVPSQSARSCLAGDADACLVSFGLGLDDFPVEDWYTPEERHLLVSRRGIRMGRGLLPLSGCLARDYAACDQFFAEFWDRTHATPQSRLWALPFDGEVRGSLLWYALTRGGEGAWGRLLQHAADTPLAALEAASGMTGAELAAGWHRWLLENRPARNAGLGSVALGALFWTTLLFALAARSTRWRFG